MRHEAIFAPVCVLALWTMVVLCMTGFRRIRAVSARRVPRRAFRLGESAEVPDDVTIANRNLMNLLEMPLLFYVASIAFYVTHQTTSRVLALSWIYVALRMIHSFIHLTYNRIVHRLIVFALGNVVLVTLWIVFIRRALVRGRSVCTDPAGNDHRSQTHATKESDPPI